MLAARRAEKKKKKTSSRRGAGVIFFHFSMKRGIGSLVSAPLSRSRRAPAQLKRLASRRGFSSARAAARAKGTFAGLDQFAKASQRARESESDSTTTTTTTTSICSLRSPPLLPLRSVTLSYPAAARRLTSSSPSSQQQTTNQQAHVERNY